MPSWIQSSLVERKRIAHFGSIRKKPKKFEIYISEFGKMRNWKMVLKNIGRWKKTKQTFSYSFPRHYSLFSRITPMWSQKNCKEFKNNTLIAVETASQSHNKRYVLGHDFGLADDGPARVQCNQSCTTYPRQLLLVYNWTVLHHKYDNRNQSILYKSQFNFLEGFMRPLRPPNSNFNDPLSLGQLLLSLFPPMFDCSCNSLCALIFGDSIHGPIESLLRHKCLWCTL